MHPIVERLKERKLVQWALAYLAVAFAILQGVELIGGQFGWPLRLLQSITLLVATGFFVTLVLAWYHGERGHQRVTGAELLLIAGVFTISGVLLASLGPRGPSPRVSDGETATTPDARPLIAVLPFDNIGGDPEDAFFADGMHDEIITQLSKIAAVRVISRTSVLGYRDVARNLRSIANELGASHIVEGSVRRGADTVRITAQLIDASADEHVWADTYDRAPSMENLLDIQTEIAVRITSGVGATVTESEREQIVRLPTENLAAYEDFLRGKSMLGTTSLGQRPVERGLELLEQAVSLDPDFTLARAWVVRAHVWLVWGFSQFDHLTLAEEALGELVNRAPEAVETRWAQGVYYYQGSRDYEPALEHLRAAQRLSPGDPQVAVYIAYIRRRQGFWDEALAGQLEAAGLDPRNRTTAFQLGSTYLFLGRAGDATAWYDKAIELDPDVPNAHERKFTLRTALGDTVGAREVLEQAPSTFDAWWFASRRARLAQLRRDLDAAERHWRSAGESRGRGYHASLGRLHHLRGDAETARAFGDSLRQSAEQRLTVELENPQASPLLAGLAMTNLALAHTLLGDRSKALEFGQRAYDSMPVEVDAIQGSGLLRRFAETNLVLGDSERTIDLLELLWSRPHNQSAGVGWLRLDPFYDPLREHPRFQALLEEYGTN